MSAFAFGSPTGLETMTLENDMDLNNNTLTGLNSPQPSIDANPFGESTLDEDPFGSSTSQPETSVNRGSTLDLLDEEPPSPLSIPYVGDGRLTFNLRLKAFRILTFFFSCRKLV